MKLQSKCSTCHNMVDIFCQRQIHEAHTSNYTLCVKTEKMSKCFEPYIIKHTSTVNEPQNTSSEPYSQNSYQWINIGALKSLHDQLLLGLAVQSLQYFHLWRLKVER